MDRAMQIIYFTLHLLTVPPEPLLYNTYRPLYYSYYRAICNTEVLPNGWTPTGTSTLFFKTGPLLSRTLVWTEGLRLQKRSYISYLPYFRKVTFNSKPRPTIHVTSLECAEHISHSTMIALCHAVKCSPLVLSRHKLYFIYISLQAGKKGVSVPGETYKISHINVWEFAEQTSSELII